MDIKGYISSGVIESYVLGMASEGESYELEQLCQQYPEVKQALLAAQAHVEDFAKLYAQQPPAGSREKMLNTLINEQLVEVPPQTVSIKARSTKYLSPYAYITAASIVLLILGGIYHVSTINRLKMQLLSVANRQDTLPALANYRDNNKLEQRLAIVEKPSIRKLELRGVPGYERNSASLYWDSTTKEVFLLPVKLAALPLGKQYQLWAIVGGKPVNAGVFKQIDLNSIQQMKSIPNAEMFAITIEKEGGAASPTLTQMVVAVKI